MGYTAVTFDHIALSDATGDEAGIEFPKLNIPAGLA